MVHAKDRKKLVVFNAGGRCILKRLLSCIPNATSPIHLSGTQIIFFHSDTTVIDAKSPANVVGPTGGSGERYPKIVLTSSNRIFNGPEDARKIFTFHSGK